MARRPNTAAFLTARPSGSRGFAMPAPGRMTYWALGWTVAFGAVGILLNTIMFFAIEAITPGSLRTIVTEPGPVRPLAYVAASVAVSVGAIVCASIA